MRDTKYITHHRFKELALCGETLNIPYGAELTANGDYLTLQDGRAVCCRSSENAQIHFAANDDGKGLRRGALTYAIAYSARRAGNGFRFSDEEVETLNRDWRHFLRKTDAVLFNEDFFAADPEELEKLAKALNIKIRR